MHYVNLMGFPRGFFVSEEEAGQFLRDNGFEQIENPGGGKYPLYYKHKTNPIFASIGKSEMGTLGQFEEELTTLLQSMKNKVA